MIVDTLQFALLIFLDRHQSLDYCCSLLVGTLVHVFFGPLGFDNVDACMQMLFLFSPCLPLHSCMFSLSMDKRLKLVSRAGFIPFVLCLNFNLVSSGGFVPSVLCLLRDFYINMLLTLYSIWS